MLNYMNKKTDRKLFLYSESFRLNITIHRKKYLKISLESIVILVSYATNF
jgi:hypothetical protein